MEGTDGVYIFRNGGHQSIFIVTRDGVIATDPVGYGRPTGGTTLELSFVGINHSDSTLVFRLPLERVLFVVNLLPVGTFPGRGT